MIESLAIGPFTVALVPLYAGPLLEAKGETEPLAWLLNSAVERPAAGLADAIGERREWSDAMVFVCPPDDDREDTALRSLWAERTGEQLRRGCVARVGMMGLAEPFAVPWTVLQDGLAQLRAIRAEWQPEPGPWLFIRPARRPFLTPEDHRLVLELEAEAAAIVAFGSSPTTDLGDGSLVFAERRRAFLVACDDAGIFAADHGAVREQWLYNLSAFLLLELRRAVAEQGAGRIRLDGASREIYSVAWPIPKTSRR